jgi:hypothetical protein
MADNRELPHSLAAVHPHHSVLNHTEIAIAPLSLAVADARSASALTLGRDGRRWRARIGHILG